MEKFKFISGVTKSPFDRRDLLLEPFLFDIELPAEIDYSPDMTPIKNQGNEGACTGFAAAYLKEHQEKIDYELKGDKYIQLSPRFAYENAKAISHSAEGSTMKAVSQGLIDKGICEEKFWPYIPKNIGKPHEDAYINGEKYKELPVYARITSEKQLKTALIKYGVILAGVLVYKNWYKAKNGHIPNATIWELLQGPLGGHAIAICGYNDKNQEYKFINSWGEKWGDKGFGYITYKHMKLCLQDCFALIDFNDPSPAKGRRTVGDLSLWERIKLW